MNKIVVYTQAYNAERTIKYTIESILSQTYDNFCYYILDNGSVDMTGKIIDEYIKKDKRIIKLINKKNNFRAMWEYLPLIINNYENAWFAVLDSDDTYHPMFFEKMLDFATNNNLDIVSCGYDTIDAKTGKLIMRRALDRNLIISGEKYRDDFIYYRRYMCGVWCKLYSFSLLKKGVLNAAEPYTYYLQSSDNAFTTKAFKLSNRAGILGESLHRYYISENSASYTFVPSRVESDQSLFICTKEYLLSYGEISKINEDYLYAIYLGLIQETLKVIYNTNLKFTEKLKYISDIFECQITKEMLALDKARGDWIIFLDCDEYFSEQSITLIRNTIRKISGNRNINGILTELINIDKNKNIISSIKNVSPRIFRNRKSLRYKNKIHELLVDAKSKEANSAVVCLDATNDIKIFHTGYDKSIMDDKKKNERNINLLKEELKNNPTDANLLLYISKSLYTDEQYEESLEYALKALRNMDDDKNLDYYPVIYSTILHTMYVLGYGKDDMQAMFDEAVSKYPEHPDYYRAIGLALIRSGDIKEAIEFLEKCVLYCNNYRSNIESFALGQIEKVYSELLGAYIIDDNRPKIVEISAALLNADKYDYENLSVLIKTLLTQEKEEAVIQFLSKIYDYRNFKDKIYLLKSSEVSENEKLINYYKSLMNEEELRAYKNI